MNDHQRSMAAMEAALTLRSIAVRLAERDQRGETVVDRMRAAQGQMRAATYDAVGSSSTISDPTSTGRGVRRDRATADLRHLDSAFDALKRSVERVTLILDAYPVARTVNQLDRLELDRLNLTPEPGCANCARVDGPLGGPRWEPVDLRVAEPTDCGGKLAAPVWLCSWCRNRCDLWGRLPSKAELNKHHRGERVPWPKDVERPA